jgi:transposase
MAIAVTVTSTEHDSIGHSRTAAASLCGIDRQTLRDWVHRYNGLGFPGLSDRVPPGSKPRLSPEQEAELAKIVRERPAIPEHGVVLVWRVDLSRAVEARFGVRQAKRTARASDGGGRASAKASARPRHRHVAHKNLCRFSRRHDSSALPR